MLLTLLFFHSIHLSFYMQQQAQGQKEHVSCDLHGRTMLCGKPREPVLLNEVSVLIQMKMIVVRYRHAVHQN